MYRDNIIFVAGTICSGKSYFASNLADDLDFDFIEVSRLVGSILSSSERNDLQGHPELLDQIIHAIGDIRTSTRKKGLVISGPRQWEILRAYPDSECIWMDTPMDVCFERFQNRKDEKDGDLTQEAFDDYLRKDDELGLQEVKQYITLQNFKKDKV